MSEEEIRKIIQRVPVSLHEKAKRAAKAAGMSLNSYINKLIEADESDDRKRLDKLEGEFWHLVDRVERIDKRLDTIDYRDDRNEIEAG